MHFWNINGGGLVGEFNVWSVSCPKLREEWRHLQSTTALRGDSEDIVLLTGTSTGYIQVREVGEGEGVEGRREWRGRGSGKGNEVVVEREGGGREEGEGEGVEGRREWRGRGSGKGNEVVVEREGGGREEGREWKGAWSEEGRELKRSGFLLGRK